MTSLITKSAVRETTELNVSADVYDQIEEELVALILRAEQRAKDNGRKTLKARDI